MQILPIQFGKYWIEINEVFKNTRLTSFTALCPYPEVRKA